jgi:formylglycine-generating enzyme required for sulfatase activity
MHGNVFEWCMDQYNDDDSDYASGPATDPVGIMGITYTHRGGCWHSSANNCRSAYRYSNFPSRCNENIGFRVIFYP